MVHHENRIHSAILSRHLQTTSLYAPIVEHGEDTRIALNKVATRLVVEVRNVLPRDALAYILLLFLLDRKLDENLLHTVL